MAVSSRRASATAATASGAPAKSSGGGVPWGVAAAFRPVPSSASDASSSRKRSRARRCGRDCPVSQRCTVSGVTRSSSAKCCWVSPMRLRMRRTVGPISAALGYVAGSITPYSIRAMKRVRNVIHHMIDHRPRAVTKGASPPGNGEAIHRPRADLSEMLSSLLAAHAHGAQVRIHARIHAEPWGERRAIWPSPWETDAG